MQIPLTLPEQTTPLPTRRDVQALSPVSPVPGVEALAETLDPRLALQWTQPVLGDQPTDASRSVLEGATLAPSDTAGLSPPLRTTSAVAWSALAQLLGPLLQRVSDAQSPSSVPWPDAPPSPLLKTDAAPLSSTHITQALQSLRTQLAQSDVFAAHHLVRHWFTLPERDSSKANEFGQTADLSLLSRWVDALSPESVTAQDITRLLLNGKMQWQGELLPGIAVTLDREDAWREDPQHPGQAQKGAALRATIDLPRSGRLTVLAYQWGSQIDMRIQMPASDNSPLDAAWTQLQDRLSQLNLPDLKVARIENP